MRRLLLLTWILILPTALFGQNYPTSVSIYVNDFAEIVDDETEARITEVLKGARENRDAEITVVTINQIADYGATGSVPNFATGLFNSWGVGDADKNNGALMLVSLQDREVFIALGDGYPAQYDDLMDHIFDQYMKDNFRAERYAEGVEDGTNALVKRITTKYSDLGQFEPSLWERFSAWLSEWFWMILFGMVFLFLLLHRAISDQMVKFRKCPTCGTRHLSRGRETTKKATRQETGEQIVRITCSNCDYRDETTLTISRVSSSRSSSGGSFGGGSSSGGGGGGRW